MTDNPNPPAPACLACGRTAEEIPLLALNYRGEAWHICPQHLPQLIHQPHVLANRLPGSESFGAAAADDHDHD